MQKNVTGQAEGHMDFGSSLENPALTALTGPHADIAEVVGSACRYPADVSPFFALPDDPSEADWGDAAILLSDGSPGFHIAQRLRIPDKWHQVGRTEALQMVAPRKFGRPDREVVSLGERDVPAMLRLAEETEPGGPFARRTVELGGHCGIWQQERLVAMAGYRFRGPGWTEISTVCTAPDQQRKGFASRVMRHVAAAIESTGDTPVLHVLVNNSSQHMYSSMGFTVRQRFDAAIVRSPLWAS